MMKWKGSEWTREWNIQARRERGKLQNLQQVSRPKFEPGHLQDRKHDSHPSANLLYVYLFLDWLNVCRFLRNIFTDGLCERI
jgi:hypothetical protein